MPKNINNNMKDISKKVEEVALYIRVSTEEQATNGDSLRTQREELTKYALSNNFHIMGIYEDDGFSATNLNRPALQRMLEDVKQNKINRILITKLDRLSRGVRNYYKILDTLDDHEVYWQTIFEKYDSSTANGRLHINIMLSVAENESAQTSERIKSVFRNKVQQKELISGSIPVGYKKDGKNLIVDEANKKVVIDAFEYYNKTNSVYKVVEMLNLNYPELHINYPRTKRMLSNKLYIGIKKTKYGDIEDFCKPIIDKELFNKTQNLLEKNSRKRTNEVSTFIFGGMLRCSECGHKMSGKFCKDFPVNCLHYYICGNSHLYKKCSNKWQLNETKIEKKLLEIIVPEIQKYIDICQAKKVETKKKDNTKEINNINRQLEKLRDLYVKDLIQINHYEKQYKELVEKLETLTIENNTPKEEKEINLNSLKSFLTQDFLLIYNNLSREQKRRIWLSIIDHIEIDNKYKMKIFFI